MRASLPFDVDGVSYVGTAILQRVSSGQKIRLRLPEKTAVLSMTTCHREEVWLKPSASFEYRWVPTIFLENWDSCLMTWTAITQQGNALHAVIDFTSNETLPGKSQCNGINVDSLKGATFCQARAGLVQRIVFNERTIAMPGAGCPLLTADGNSYTYAVGEGLCAYGFASVATKARHRLTTRGYTTLEKE